jgi:hypothetical protein
VLYKKETIKTNNYEKECNVDGHRPDDGNDDGRMLEER